MRGTNMTRRRRLGRAAAGGVALCLAAGLAAADAPRIEAATASELGGAWTFNVTISHPDTGWDHYADGWEVLSPGGERLAYRELAHPHVDEQPFTRSVSGVMVPDGIDRVIIRARDNVDGWGPQRYELRLR